MVRVTKFEIIAVALVCYLLDTIFDREPGSVSSIMGILCSALLTMGFGAILQKMNANSKLWWWCCVTAFIGWLAGLLF